LPALYNKESKILLIFTCSLLFIYTTTNLIAYKILLPYCWDFFSGFELNYEKDGINLQLEARLSDYINFITQIIFILNMCLNSCLLLGFFLLKISIHMTTKLRKIVYFSSFGISTLITPPDIVSQILVGIFFIFLYETCLLLLFLRKEYKKGE
jgi:sec-independent protein translocase protein TatC